MSYLVAIRLVAIGFECCPKYKIGVCERASFVVLSVVVGLVQEGNNMLSAFEGVANFNQNI